MKKILLIHLIFLLLFGCGHYPITNNSKETSRTPSSEIENQCQVSLLSNFKEEEHSLCSWAQNYLRLLGNPNFTLNMNSTTQENSEKRKILTLSAQLSKKEIDLVLGRGGLRIRYLRYMLNELSYQQALANTIDDSQKKNVIKNFPLVELILEPQD